MEMPTFEEELRLWRDEVEYVIGVDEVGRGCFAGPVTAGAVVFKKKAVFRNDILTKINDSKLLNPKMRSILSKEIKKEASFYSVSTVGVSVINKVGIGKATEMAMGKAIESIRYKVLSSKYRADKLYVLIDGFHIKYLKGVGLKNQRGIIKGDRKSISIAAASIIAKVHRDRLMRKLNKKYPQYGFYRNKGYGTRFHQNALRTYGLSTIHRTSFKLNKFLRKDSFMK